MCHIQKTMQWLCHKKTINIVYGWSQKHGPRTAMAGFSSLGNMLYIMIPGETSGDQYCSLDIPQAYDPLNVLCKPLHNASLSTVCLH